MKLDLRILLAIGAGGALGSIARYVVNVLIQSRASTTFPIGILAINVVGSLLLGFIMRLTLETSALGPEMRFFLTAGFCGGFTTFSTFSYDTLSLIESGQLTGAAGYVISSVILSIAGTFAGAGLAQQLGALLRAKASHM